MIASAVDSLHLDYHERSDSDSRRFVSVGCSGPADVDRAGSDHSDK